MTKALVLAFGLALALSLPAEARPGATTDASVKVSRQAYRQVTPKLVLDHVNYWTEHGKVLVEVWAPPEGQQGWTIAQAEQLREIVMGGQKFTRKLEDDADRSYFYPGGIRVDFELAKGSQQIVVVRFESKDGPSVRGADIHDKLKKPYKGIPWR